MFEINVMKLKISCYIYCLKQKRKNKKVGTSVGAKVKTKRELKKFKCVICHNKKLNF